jgi:hypothetical protein
LVVVAAAVAVANLTNPKLEVLELAVVLKAADTVAAVAFMAVALVVVMEETRELAAVAVFVT